MILYHTQDSFTWGIDDWFNTWPTSIIKYGNRAKKNMVIAKDGKTWSHSITIQITTEKKTMSFANIILNGELFKGFPLSSGMC